MVPLRRTLLALAAGVCLTILSAWLLHLRSPARPTPGPHSMEVWPADVPATWPPEPQRVFVQLGVGVTDVFAFSVVDHGAAAVLIDDTDAVSVHVFRAGWPFRSLQCAAYTWTSPAQAVRGYGPFASTGAFLPARLQYLALPGRAELPIRPVWAGFLANAAIFSTLAFALATALFELRRRSRLGRGLCPACAYPSGTSTTCTECGTPLPSMR